MDDQLTGHFPMLLEFVKKAEQQQKRLAVAEGQHIPNFAPQQVRAFNVSSRDGQGCRSLTPRPLPPARMITARAVLWSKK